MSHSFGSVDIINILFLAGCVLGCVAIVMETHLHGFMQFLVWGMMGIVTANMIGLVAQGEMPTHWMLLGVKVLTSCGVGVLTRITVHWLHHDKHQPFPAILAGICGVLFVGFVFSYSPGLGLRSPAGDMVASDFIPGPPPYSGRMTGPVTGPVTHEPSPDATATVSARAPTPPVPEKPKHRVVVYSELSSAASQKGIAPLNCDDLSPTSRKADKRCSP